MSTTIYEVFTEFIKKTVKEKKSFFQDVNNGNAETIFTADSLGELVERYVKNYIGDKNTDKGSQLLEKLQKKETDSKKKTNIELNFIYKVNEQLFNTDKNVFEKNNAISDNAKKVFGHLMWLQYLPASKPRLDNEWGKTKCEQINSITGIKVKYDTDGCAGYGMAAMRLDEDLTDLVLLFNELVKITWEKDSPQEPIEQIKNHIIEWCLNLNQVRSKAYVTNANERKCPEEPLPIHNMLLHLCKPEHYAPIAVFGHKKKIVETFEGLIPKKGSEHNNQNNTEKELDLSQASGIKDDDNQYNIKYYIILNELYNNKSNNQKTSTSYKGLNEIVNVVNIYGEYRPLWDVGSDKDYSDINALKFKKSIILYGPPGTSKTYSAEGLAKNLIFRLDCKKEKVDEFIIELSKKKEEQFKYQIHRLQLHPNYTYEDFIWGYQIVNKEYKNKGKVICVGNQTVAKKGFFLKLLKQLEDKKTHILILDEINRVDLSRLFGELFSAIEKRNEPIDLPVEVEGIRQISIPNNLYIIGTMNEIDFSLERVDFALRRRFAWFFYGYEEDRLKDILEYKLKKNPLSKLSEDVKIKYVEDCTALNKKIDEDPDLGKQYQIGHTFFAELQDIWKDKPQKEIKSIKSILWNISIGPMIEAYLGNCDKETKENKIKAFRLTFGIDEK